MGLRTLARQFEQDRNAEKFSEIIESSKNVPFSMQKIFLRIEDLIVAHGVSNPYKIQFPFNSVYFLSSVPAGMTFRVHAHDDNIMQSENAIELKEGQSFSFPKTVAKGFLTWDAQDPRYIGGPITTSNGIVGITLYFFLNGSISSNQVTLEKYSTISIFDGDYVVPGGKFTCDDTGTVFLWVDTAGLPGEKIKGVISQIFRNHSSSNSVWLSSSMAGTDDSGIAPGIKLLPGQSYTWNSDSVLIGITEAGLTAVVSVVNIFKNY